MRNLEEHFAFGDNWASFAREIDGEKREHAIHCLQKLLAKVDLAGKRFLDIGSGSGLHALAALELGCGWVTAVDLDPLAAATSRHLLQQLAPNDSWQCHCQSVFDLTVQEHGTFDIVYSWGVLHHTGALWQAMGKAADLVAEGGVLVVALYLPTPFCGFWRWEKKIYSRLPNFLQKPILYIFIFLKIIARILRGATIGGYSQKRGMSLLHDAHDWLGGYPYETASPQEVDSFLLARGFLKVESFVQPPPGMGLFGSNCAEYVYGRSPASPCQVD